MRVPVAFPFSFLYYSNPPCRYAIPCQEIGRTEPPLGDFTLHFASSNTHCYFAGCGRRHSESNELSLILLGAFQVKNFRDFELVEQAVLTRTSDTTEFDIGASELARSVAPLFAEIFLVFDKKRSMQADGTKVFPSECKPNLWSRLYTPGAPSRRWGVACPLKLLREEKYH
ncbi:hypothetical protein EVAR_99209_1 [Eumeta japonica]|uniref:Uncharacterized protein n=1 Tax=Eumeta variegata TaxID=151549 RepID=A0A4C1YT60_EUMVA|nr:hypothetical protein EVAR_99209_1 [Eumeta japonica]